jgi:Domain of unknown function (DUF5916)
VRTAYNVLRLKRLVGSSGDVGVLATATNRFDPAQNDAYVASVDGRWRSPSGDYAAAAQALASALVHGSARAEPDGIPIEPGKIAGGGSLYVGKQGGAHWLWSAWQHVAGRELEFNDLGYLERKNDYQGYFNLAYRTASPWWRTVETRTTLQLGARETLDGTNLWNAVELNTWWNLASFWSFYVEVHYRGPHFDDRETGDGAALERAGLIGVEASIASDPRRRVTGWIFGQAHRLTDGAHYEARGQLTFRFLPQLELDLLPTFTQDHGEPRYVAPSPSPDASYVFGVQEARSVGGTVRAAYTFTPELTLQVYAQAFLSRVHYPRFYTFTAPGPPVGQHIHLADLAPADAAHAPATNPDGAQSTLNVNVVLRWEYHLGSTLFLVYTRSQNPPLTFAPNTEASLDLRPIRDGRAAVDVVMAKLAYWWG